MIRFVYEKDIDLDSPRPVKKVRSQEKGVQIRMPVVEDPQDAHTSSQALRLLKKHNDQTSLLKGRLSVLQIQEEKNQFKAFMNQQRFQFHEQMREEMQKQKQRKARHLQKMLQQMHESQEQARLQRIEHELHMKKVQSKINSSRYHDYSSTKQRQKDGQMSINNLKKEDLGRKKQRNVQIRQYEKTQKSKVKQYLDNKKKDIHSNDNEDSMKFSQIREERKKQFSELSKLQEMMLQRQARSRIENQKSQSKLKNLLNNRHPVSTSHTTKLPSIGLDRRSQQDLFVL